MFTGINLFSFFIVCFSPEDKKNITYKLLPKKPTKVLQDSLHTLYDRLIKELPRQGHDEVTLDMAPIDQDFKRKHREVTYKQCTKRLKII